MWIRQRGISVSAGVKAISIHKRLVLDKQENNSKIFPAHYPSKIATSLTSNFSSYDYPEEVV